MPRGPRLAAGDRAYVYYVVDRWDHEKRLPTPLFRSDALIDMLARLGAQVRLTVKVRTAA